MAARAAAIPYYILKRPFSASIWQATRLPMQSPIALVIVLGWAVWYPCYQVPRLAVQQGAQTVKRVDANHHIMTKFL